MQSIEERISGLSPEQRKSLEEFIKREQATTDSEDRIVWVSETIRQDFDEMISFYKSLSGNQERLGSGDDSSKSIATDLIRFSPYPEPRPGLFSVLVDSQIDKHSEELNYYLAKQEEMKRVFYRGIEFSSINKIIDIGCGYSADLIELAKKHPHIHFDGYNISPDQIALGNKRIESLGLENRIKLYNRNSAKDSFPDQYDLALSFQVIHHIREKNDVIKNVADHLKQGGYFILSESISNLVSSPIEAPQSTAYFVSKDEWAQMFAANGLKIVEGVDASREMANFLYDPDFEEKLSNYSQVYDHISLSHLKGPFQLGELLKEKLALYMIMTVQKDVHLDKTTLLRLNRMQIDNMTMYAKTIAEDCENPQLLPKKEAIVHQGKTLSETGHLIREHILRGKNEEQKLLSEYLLQEVGSMLGIDPSKIDEHQTIIDLGFTSLMAIQLKNRIDRDLWLDISMKDLFKVKNIIQFVKMLSARLKAEIKIIDDELLASVEAST